MNGDNKVDMEDVEVICNLYEVSFNINGHGTAVDTQYIFDGDMVSDPSALREEHYIFGGWYADEDLTSEFDFNTPITEDTEVYAKWTGEKKTVSFNGNGQTITIEPQSIEYGKTAAEPLAPTALDVAFGGWYTDSTLTTEFDFSTPITADTELFARWTEFYNVGDADGNGKVTATDAAIVFEYVVSGNKSVLPIKDKYKDYMSIVDTDGDGDITKADSDIILEKARGLM